MQKLQDNIKWSFNRSFLKSTALYKNLDNRKLLAKKDDLIAKRWDEFLDMRNKFYDANRKHIRETYAMKQQIKRLEKDKKDLQLQHERLVAAAQ